jgi:O-glycosyl hydrolase
VNHSITDKKSGAIKADGYKDISNRVDPKYFKHFCKWMVEYVKFHEARGAPFYAVSPGNEVQFTQSFESCVWDGKDFATIVTMLRQMLDAEGFQQVKIFGPETMTSHLYDGGTPSYVKMIQADPKALAALDIFATHGYEDGVRAEMSANSSRAFWNLIKDTGKPFWITEGGTEGHDWPEPITKGVGNALHNALVAGNCSAFVPWQITDARKTTHNLMVNSEYTPKTYTLMHYSKFIQPGAKRIDAMPGFGPVQVSAFLHEKDAQLTVVALNPTEQSHPLNLSFMNLKDFPSLDAYRTSATENLTATEPVTVRQNKASVTMPPLSIVTLTGKEAK